MNGLDVSAPGAVSGPPRAARLGRIARRCLGIIAALPFLPTVALAAEDASSGGVFDTKNVYFLAAGAAVGWLGKLLAENINGGLAARREFIKETSVQISALAKEHYWALANHAGVLAGMLEEYLHFIDYHLLLEWDGPDELYDRLGEIAKVFSDQSFYKFCRLIWLFDKFQFEGSNTYLITTDLAGRSCRQLYNSFMMTLPVSEDYEQARLDTLAILAVMYRSVTVIGRDKPVPGCDLTEAEFNAMTDDADDPTLRVARAAYREWLAGRPDQVCIAAQSLRAYNELLSHELAHLYRDWFRHKPRSDQAFADLVAYRQWPDVLTSDSVLAIHRARSGSELLQSLGRARDRPRQQDNTGKQPMTDQTKPQPEPQKEPL